MNTYLDKEAAKSELRDTGVIGAMGVGTGLVSNHVVNKLELNGKLADKAVGHSTPLMAKIRAIGNSPVKSLKSTLASKGFKNGAKIGAIGGAIGLAGDYAAVKINKALEKKASNKFLEKIAEMYSVKGHPGAGRGIFKSPTMQLNREEYHEYAKGVHSHPINMLPGATALGLGGLAAHIAHKRGGRPLVAGMIGASVGSLLTGRIADNIAHRKTLEHMKMVHPHMLNED